jgi:hypothetical protein
MLHGPPLHIVIELLHDGQPFFQNSCSVVSVVIGCCPADMGIKTLSGTYTVYNVTTWFAYKHHTTRNQTLQIG